MIIVTPRYVVPLLILLVSGVFGEDDKTYPPHYPKGCVGGCPVEDRTLWQMFFCGTSASYETNGCDWDEYVGCGVRTKEECEKKTAKYSCWWFDNDEKNKKYFGEGSCLSVKCQNRFTALFGNPIFFGELRDASPEYNDLTNQPTMQDYFTCLSYSRLGEKGCNSKTDTHGRPCRMCSRIPHWWYPFPNAPLEKSENFLLQDPDKTPMQWCLSDSNMPRMCDFIRRPSYTCDGHKPVNPDDDIPTTAKPTSSTAFTRLSISVVTHTVTLNKNYAGNHMTTPIIALLFIICLTFFL